MIVADDVLDEMSHVGLFVVETPQAIDAPPEYANLRIELIAMHGGVCESDVE